MRMIVKTLCKLDELSLNPVLVSICWQVLLFLELDVEIEFSHTLILGLSVWMAYSADRFCEHLHNNSSLSRRHSYWKDRKKVFYGVWLSAFTLSLLGSGIFLDWQKITAGMFLFSVVFMNLLVCIQENKTNSIVPYFREARTSLLLSIGCFFFPFFKTGINFSQLALYLIILTNLFLINCLATNYLEESKKFENLLITKHAHEKKNLDIPNLLKASFFSLFFLLCMNKEEASEFIYSLVLCGFASCILVRTKIDVDIRRVFLDFCYWIIPLIYFSLSFL